MIYNSLSKTTTTKKRSMYEVKHGIYIKEDKSISQFYTVFFGKGKIFFFHRVCSGRMKCWWKRSFKKHPKSIKQTKTLKQTKQLIVVLCLFQNNNKLSSGEICVANFRPPCDCCSFEELYPWISTWCTHWGLYLIK